MQVVVDSLLTNYQDIGRGKTILLLHGWGDSSRGLSSFQTQLAKHYRVVAVDLPGFGGSQTPPNTWGLNDYADFILAFCKKTNIKVDVLTGHSNGGAIAIRSLSRGLTAKHLVLIASAGIRGEYKGRMKALRLVTKAGKALTRPLPNSVKKRLRQKVYSTVGSDMLVAEHLQETFKKVISDDVRADATKLKLPTLLIYGDQDVSTPPRYGQMLHHAIAKSKLIIVPGGDHYLPTNKTDELVKLITEFLS